MITGKPWTEFKLSELVQTSDEPGIFELADEHLDTIYIGSSGAEGVRSRLMHYRKDRPDPCIAARAYFFRVETCENNMAWQARILEAYRGAHGGQLPPCNPHTVHEDIGSMLHCVLTDKYEDRVVEDLKAAVETRGYTIQAVESPEDTETSYRVFEVFDSREGHPVQTQPLSALPCLVSVSKEGQKMCLRSIRPTMLLEMFHQETLREAAQAAEKVAVASMDEAAE